MPSPPPKILVGPDHSRKRQLSLVPQTPYTYYTNMSIQTDQVRSRLEWLSTLSAGPEPSEDTKYLRKTSIIATIGPKVNNVEMLGQLRKAGMNVVRMNFSHGSYEYHQSVIDNVHKLVELEPDARPLAIALDTKGPEIRTGLMRPGCDDKKDLQFGVKNGVDMIFASFIRRAQDVTDIREVLGPDGAAIKIIVKIENEQGVENFDEILREADGVMVARGDLGIEIPASQVFIAQKMMIAKCNIAGKPVICATQMLESMTYNPRPTRAEVSDVANAVLDGADCVMLSGETAKGAYPIQSGKYFLTAYIKLLMMAETCFLAESTICYPPLFDELRAVTPRPTETAETVGMAAVAAASEQGASAILVLSTSGNTARLISKYRPNVPIITGKSFVPLKVTGLTSTLVTRNQQTARQIHLHRGCYPFWYPEPRGIEAPQWQRDVDNRIRFGLRSALKLKIIRAGTTVIAVQGWKGGLGHTNTLRILSVPTDPADLEGVPLGA
ncbi:Pyruvate kinase [Ceratobasidium sp. 392]|nr:Pyruvate kinase [Ceratobasidium sp. 392]